MRYSSITTLAGTTTFTFNHATADTGHVAPDRCSGMDGTGPLRTNVEDAPGADGGLVFAPLLGPRLITLGGMFRVTSSGTEAGYLAAADVLIAALSACLDSMRAANGTLTWVDGTGSHNLTVRMNTPLECPAEAAGGYVKGFIFGLVAANPTAA